MIPKLYHYISTYTVPLQFGLYWMVPNLRKYLLPPIFAVLVIGCYEALRAPIPWYFISVGILFHLSIILPVLYRPIPHKSKMSWSSQEAVIDALIWSSALAIVALIPVWQYHQTRLQMMVTYTLLTALGVVLRKQFNST